MGRKRKNRWEPTFGESLRDKRDKEDAAYIARNLARTEGIKRALTGQARKDEYNKIMREFDDPEARVEITLDRHKERISFLEKVLDENRQWRKIRNEPLQLKPNPVELAAKIQTMKEYVAEKSRDGGWDRKRRTEISPDSVKNTLQAPDLKPEQVSLVYDRAQEKIQNAHGALIERLSKNITQGLPVERARERLITLGVSKLVSESLNELISEGRVKVNEDLRHSVKLKLLHPDSIGTLIDRILQNPVN